MSDQPIFASLDYAAKKKRTKREVFLTEMAAIVPWARLKAVIEAHYPKARAAGRQGGRDGARRVDSRRLQIDLERRAETKSLRPGESRTSRLLNFGRG